MVTRAHQDHRHFIKCSLRCLRQVRASRRYVARALHTIFMGCISTALFDASHRSPQQHVAVQMDVWQQRRPLRQAPPSSVLSSSTPLSPIWHRGLYADHVLPRPHTHGINQNRPKARVCSNNIGGTNRHIMSPMFRSTTITQYTHHKHSLDIPAGRVWQGWLQQYPQHVAQGGRGHQYLNTTLKHKEPSMGLWPTPATIRRTRYQARMQPIKTPICGSTTTGIVVRFDCRAFMGICSSRTRCLTTCEPIAHYITYGQLSRKGEHQAIISDNTVVQGGDT